MSDTEITFTAAYTCTHHNDRQRAACPVCLVAALTAERDELRAEVERCNDIINRASVQFFHDGTDGETAAKMLKVLNEAKP
jgi:transposase-like protein